MKEGRCIKDVAAFVYMVTYRLTHLAGATGRSPFPCLETPVPL